MKNKILFLTLIIFISGLANVCLAQDQNPLNSVPQPFVDLFNIFSNWKIDFSKVPLVNQIPQYLPRSGEDVGRSFQGLVGGLDNFNNWITNNIGLNILLVIKKVGEIFVWILESLAYLLKTGLSYINY